MSQKRKREAQEAELKAIEIPSNINGDAVDLSAETLSKIHAALTASTLVQQPLMEGESLSFIFK